MPSLGVMLMMLEIDARLHRQVMKHAIFFQINILCNPSLGPPFIINTSFCIKSNVRDSDYLIIM